MYIRVKRSKTTYFIRCDPTETVLDIKEKLQVLIDQPVNNQRLILVGTGEVLEDSKTLADHKVENDSVVALTLRKGGLLNSFLSDFYASPVYYWVPLCIFYVADRSLNS
ncbi:ubiquitin-like protein [Quercus suber]|uniref:Ubiquitin-like protein n=3 Tax=Quercus suber TaxID=58331 RepID=A0AAW0IMU4_QUESU